MNNHKKVYSKDEFIKRNQNIYEGIEASDIELTIDSSEDDTIQYKVKMKTLAGEISFDNQTKIKDGKIFWDDSFVFPSLEKTDKVRISEDDASRGRILDRKLEKLLLIWVKLIL